MNKVWLKFITLFSLSSAALFGSFTMASAQEADPALVEKGAYLSKAADCAACHSPVTPNGAPYQGGGLVAIPMGQILAPNITPSKQYGIGNYSLEQFSRAVRDGIRADNVPLYPAMPYTSYNKITDEDIKALYSYFMLAVEPVDFRSSEKTDLEFPFNIRSLMHIWNVIYGKGVDVKLPADASAQIRRGEYVANALGHCSTCHTPRNMLMAEDSNRFFAGGYADQWEAFNITQDRVDGIGNWSEDKLKAYLRGHYVEHYGGAAGPMSIVTSRSLQYLTEEDMDAMVAYLKTVPAISNKVPKQEISSQTKNIDLSVIEFGNQKNPAGFSDSAAEENGAILYNGVCAACHGYNGQGSRDDTYPPLRNNPIVNRQDPRNLIAVMREGVSRDVGAHHILMPSSHIQPLTDSQIVAIANYVRNTFGNNNSHITQHTIDAIDAGMPAPFLIRYAKTLFLCSVTAAFVIIFVFASCLIKRRRKK